MQKFPDLLGAHLSIAGGLHNALIQAYELNCQAVQFFSKSNRQWHAKPLTQEAIALFKHTRQELGISTTAIHASYLINIGSPDPALHTRSVQALTQEYERASALGVDYLVLHPGSHRKTDLQACLGRIAKAINIVFQQHPTSNTKLLVETMAGQGTNVGAHFQELAHILQAVEQPGRSGICFDTCHVFAAGYDIVNQYEQVMHTWDEIIGIDQIKLFHLNDSQKELGSRVDRHEHIGKGQIGNMLFKKILQEPRFADRAKILETPKDSLEEDRMNLALLRSL